MKAVCYLRLEFYPIDLDRYVSDKDKRNMSIEESIIMDKLDLIHNGQVWCASRHYKVPDKMVGTGKTVREAVLDLAMKEIRIVHADSHL